jgi:hypothetical protein
MDSKNLPTHVDVSKYIKLQLYCSGSLAEECAVIRGSMGWCCGSAQITWICVEHKSSCREYASSVFWINWISAQQVYRVGNFTSYVMCLLRYETPVHNVGMTFWISLVCVPCQDLGQTFSCLDVIIGFYHVSSPYYSYSCLLPPVLHLRYSLREVGVPKGVAFEFVKGVNHS